MKRAFTLVELLVVIVIIAVIATIAATLARKLSGGGKGKPENSELPDVEYEIPIRE